MTKSSYPDEARRAIWIRILAAAKQLGKQGTSPAFSLDPVIQLRQGGSEVPIYFIGWGLHEFNLAQLIAVDHPIYAVEIPWPAKWHSATARIETGDLPTVDQLAAPYAAAIKAHNHPSRCILAGHSFGGVIAFEVCRQLALLNIQVEMILLFDAAAVYPSSHQVAWAKLKEIWQDKWLVTANDLGAGSATTRFSSSLWIIRWMLADKIRNGGRQVANWIMRPPEEPTTKLDETGRPITWPRIKYVYDKAMKCYRMSRVDCCGVLFRAESAQDSASLSLDVHLGWEGLFGRGLEIVTVPGSHLSMMQKPHASMLAREISRTLISNQRREAARSSKALIS